MLTSVFVVGLLSFSLTTLYLEQDITERLRNRVGGKLATLGWRERVESDPQNSAPLLPRRGRWIFRFLWSLQGCPYCLSTWIALCATVYVLRGHPWHRSFWLLWWAAVGLAWAVLTVWKLAQELVEQVGAQREAAQHEGDGDEV